MYSNTVPKSPRSAYVAVFTMKLLSWTVIRFKVRTADKLYKQLNEFLTTMKSTLTSYLTKLW